MATNLDDSASARHTMQFYNAATDLIERNLAVRPEKIAYIDDNGSYTFGDLAERVNRCAHALCELGLTLESRIMICLADTIDFPTAFLGAIKAGLVPVAVNTLLTGGDYDFMLRDSRARALIVSESLVESIPTDSRRAAVPYLCRGLRGKRFRSASPGRVDGLRQDRFHRRRNPSR